MPEHEPLLAVRRDPELAVADLAVGAAHADLERADPDAGTTASMSPID